MKWLQDCSKIAPRESGLPLYWVTPAVSWCGTSMGRLLAYKSTLCLGRSWQAKFASLHWK